MNHSRELLPLLISASFLLFIAMNTLFDVYVVSGSSMEPLIRQGRNVIVLKHFPLESIHRGDIVVYKSPLDDKPAIKQCTALAGESFQMGNRILPVGADSIAVQGLNLPVSIDSRHYGAVHRERIIGRVLFPFPGGQCEE